MRKSDKTLFLFCAFTIIITFFAILVPAVWVAYHTEVSPTTQRKMQEMKKQYDKDRREYEKLRKKHGVLVTDPDGYFERDGARCKLQ